jgi:hypothetical protein
MAPCPRGACDSPDDLLSGKFLRVAVVRIGTPDRRESSLYQIVSWEQTAD